MKNWSFAIIILTSLGVGYQASSHKQDVKTDAVRWEYICVPIEKVSTMTSNVMQVKLNELGNDGWEYVTAIYSAWVFKRPKP